MLNRRDLLRLLTAGTLGASATGCASAPQSTATTPNTTEPAPDFTAAFLTDPHIFPEKGAPEGTSRAFTHALGQSPDLILTGGDLVFDLLAATREEAETQLDLLDQVLATVNVPIYHAIGNHDVYGLDPKSGVAEDDPLRGKEFFRQRLGLERTYTSFDHNGWHFVMLDTIGIEGNHYRAWIDDEQLAWLDDDLAQANAPTVVASHIPLFSNYVEWRRGTSEGIPDNVVVANSHRVAEIFEKHPVKLALAGHLHVNETFQFKGIQFANVGAISGNWWRGLRDGFEEGYGLLEFRGDDVNLRYVDYGWEAQS